MSVIESGVAGALPRRPRLRLPLPPERSSRRGRPFYIASSRSTPLEVVELGDLLARHADSGNELRIAPSLYPLWDEVIETTLDFSGIRLRNAVRP